MYVEGNETSGYTEKDFEDYRKKYIGNIFQSFNLVNSYTVYQNVELVLLVNGYKKSKIKRKVIEAIKQVDLLKYKNTKVSKLSGGQKQRVAIARALVKDAPILVADEPTGNLDSKTAESIMELLYKVSKDKLVILVTHNFEQVKQYATRKIVINDGKIVEDKNLKNANKEKTKNINAFYPMKLSSKLRLGIRNTFNILPKFFLLLSVYVILCLATFGSYCSLKKLDYEKSKIGSNEFFKNISDRRIIIQKANSKPFSKKDYENIKQIPNVDYIVENDILLDEDLFFTSKEIYIYARADSRQREPDEVDYGRLPNKENEALLCMEKDNFPIDRILNTNFKICDTAGSFFGTGITKSEIKIVGIKIYSEEENSKYEYPKLYISDNKIKEVNQRIIANYSTTEVEFNGYLFKNDMISHEYKVIPSQNVPKGKVYVFEELNDKTEYYDCINEELTINVKNQYFSNKITVEIDEIFDEENFEELVGIEKENYEVHSKAFFINWDDFYNLFNKNSYQSSVFIKDEKQIEDTIASLENMGLKTMYVKDTLVNENRENESMNTTIMAFIVSVVIVSLFILSYFIIKIILKSRNVYFSTIRMLGITRKNAKQLLKIELLTVLHIAFLLVIIFCISILNNWINIAYIKDLLGYLQIYDYIYIYIALLIISILISNRYSKQLFKKSAINTYTEEV